MELSDTGLLRLVERAYRCALLKPDQPTVSSGQRHARRSRHFVEALAEQFRLLLPPQSSERVFSKYHAGNRDDFLLNELLYDVHVCDTAVVERKSGKRLRYVSHSVLQLESEFQCDSVASADTGLRAAMIDFSKLVAGAAAIKVFVGGIRPGLSPSYVLDVLNPLARAASGGVFAFFLPHPDSWPIGDSIASLNSAFRLDAVSGAWIELR